MITRRDVLRRAAQLGAAAALPPSTACWARESAGVVVNDVQSQLNPTRVHRIVKPRSLDELAAALGAAQRENRDVSVAGGRHSMGTQQFGTDTLLVDMRDFKRVVRFDPTAGQVEVEAGIQWPELIQWLIDKQSGQARQWGIRQKQTGVDEVTIGGSLASNIHGRGLRFPPMIGDI
jgi:FAD/FMN-containing dehydrogenase